MPDYDVLCIGNAIVDIIAQCDEAFLETNGIVKGAMNLLAPRPLANDDLDPKIRQPPSEGLVGIPVLN